jgi:hypothetical protein
LFKHDVHGPRAAPEKLIGGGRLAIDKTGGFQARHANSTAENVRSSLPAEYSARDCMKEIQANGLSGYSGCAISRSWAIFLERVNWRLQLTPDQ